MNASRLIFQLASPIVVSPAIDAAEDKHFPAAAAWNVIFVIPPAEQAVIVPIPGRFEGERLSTGESIAWPPTANGRSLFLGHSIGSRPRLHFGGAGSTPTSVDDMGVDDSPSPQRFMLVSLSAQQWRSARRSAVSSFAASWS
jgi:hypothetical protein